MAFSNDYRAFLKARRVEQKRTIYSVAKEMKVPHTHLSDYEKERRHPRIDKLEAWAGALGMELRLRVKRNGEGGG